MLKSSKLLYGLLVLSVIAICDVHGFLFSTEPPLKIASFNIQVLGQTKYSHLDVRNVLIKVGGSYLIFIHIYHIVPNSE